MKLTKEEANCASYAIQVDNDGKPRRYAVGELSLPISIVEKLKEEEPSMGTEEKAFVLSKLKEIHWPVTDGTHVTSLIEKLS